MNIEEIKQNFDLMEDAEEKFSFVIELGKQLPPYPKDKKDEEHKIYGCSSTVWFNKTEVENKYYFYFESDALIVKGLLFIIKAIFDGKSKEEIKNINAMEIFENLGLKSILSNQRQVGLSSIIAKIEELSKE
ncbi:MAG: SufE family protein [Alphaproteobacteria bacterium]|nr:SufE family protein [Alphaproteobacteria bacterium]